MRSTGFAAFAVASVVLVACTGRDRPAHGEASSLIIIAADSLWAAIEPALTAALEPRIFTVRDEATFDVTHISPFDPNWTELRRFRQVLPIGLAGDGWVADALERGGQPAEVPGIVETQDVWANRQGVTAVVLPQDDPVGALRVILPDLGTLLDNRFRQYALSRMFVTRADTSLRDSLENSAGFSLLVPNVYDRTDMGSTQVFRHHAELGGVIMRAITVTWREGTGAEPTRDMAVAWRDSVAGYAFDMPQSVDTTRIEERPLQQDAGGLEVQGVWSSTDPSWPAAGPFTDRIVVCPAQNRTYFIDAWLFAPGKKKYEYMIQLQTILDSFGCGDETAAPAAAGM